MESASTTDDALPITESNSPDSESITRRRSTFSSIYESTASSSSPELTTDTVITPESDEDGSSAVVPKGEELEEQGRDDIEETKPGLAEQSTLPTPRKRGRPRKHPIVEQKKSTHARSK